jgi:hypothetical protein
MTTKHLQYAVAFAFTALSGAACMGCGDDDTPPPPPPPPADMGVDTGMVDMGVDGGPPPGACGEYCTTVTTNCTGANAQYASMAECMAYCARARWPEGTAGDMDGNTIACRIYHGGAPAASDPATHCPHAGPSGGNVCGTVTFQTGAGTRVDRMGMPAVSTALIGASMKNAYNDANPTDDATFAGELVANLTGLHAALDDDLLRLGLTPCSTTGTPSCVSQNVAAGVTVADLVIPDVLKVNPAAAAGFPNGRRLQDPVIDVTLAVILLQLGQPCGSSTCSPTTLVGTNPPPHGDYLTTFPYLGPAVTP